MCVGFWKTYVKNIDRHRVSKLAFIAFVSPSEGHVACVVFQNKYEKKSGLSPSKAIPS